MSNKVFLATLVREYKDGTSETFTKIFDTVLSVEKWLDYIEKPYRKVTDTVYAIETEEYKTTVKIEKMTVETRQ